MLRTTIYLNEDTALAIRHQADNQRCSQADIIRTALRNYLDQVERQTRRSPVTGVGAYRSGRADVSERAETLLKKAARKRR